MRRVEDSEDRLAHSAALERDTVGCGRNSFGHGAIAPRTLFPRLTALPWGVGLFAHVYTWAYTMWAEGLWLRLRLACGNSGRGSPVFLSRIHQSLSLVVVRRLVFMFQRAGDGPRRRRFLN